MKVDTEKQKFFHLLADVCEELPADVATPVIQAGHDIPAPRLQNTRIGRHVHLETLVTIVKTCLPKFKIPKEYNIAA